MDGWYGNTFHIAGPVDSPHKGPVMWSFGVFFVVNLNKLLNKQVICQWLEMPWCSCNASVMICLQEDDDVKLSLSGPTNSKLPTPVQDLVKMIFDVESMKKAMLEFEVSCGMCQWNECHMSTHEIHSDRFEIKQGNVSLFMCTVCVSIAGLFWCLVIPISDWLKEDAAGKIVQKANPISLLRAHRTQPGEEGQEVVMVMAVSVCDWCMCCVDGNGCQCVWLVHVLCCRIWSWSPMQCEKHGPRDSVDKNRGRRPRFLSLLRPKGHVFHTAWETMIKSYYSTLADWFFSVFYSHKCEF